MRRATARLALAGLVLAIVSTVTAGVASALSVTGLDPIEYTEQGDPVAVAPEIEIDGGSFSDGYIQFSVDGATATEVLFLPSASTPDTTNGAVSVVGTAVYLGTGASYKQIGTVDPVNDGQAGRPLRVNFSAALENADFSGGVTGSGNAQTPIGWTVNRSLLTLGALASQTQGTGSQGIERGLSNGTFYSAVVAHDGHDAALRMWFSSNCPGPGYVHPYCSAFGPDAWSSPFDAKAGDALAFDWAAANGDDAYEVYGFLVDTNTNAHTELMYGRSAGSSSWTTANGTIPADGNYRFRFVAGSYDNTGGLALGASLYIDNARVLSDDASAAVAQSVARMVMYDNTSNDPAPTRTIRFEAETPTETMPAETATTNVTLVDDAPEVWAVSPITFTNTADTDVFANAAGTLPASDPEGDAITYSIAGGVANAVTIDGVSYTHSATGTFGTLHVNELTGEYVIVPAAAAINGQWTPASETFGFTATANGLSTSGTLEVDIEIATSVPGAPTNLVPAPGDGTVTLSWTAPSWLGGSSITGYQIEMSIDGGAWTNVVASTGTDATTYDVTGLTNKTPVSFRVSAINSTGTGPSSSPAGTTPVAPATAPTITKITPGNRTLTIELAAPADDGGAPVTNYEYSLDGGLTWIPRDPAGATGPLVIGPLDNGTTYPVMVRAVTAAGPGAPSTVLAASPVLGVVLPADGSPAVPEGKKGVLLVQGEEHTVAILTNYDDSSIPNDTVRIVGDGFTVDLRGVTGDGKGLDVDTRGRLVIVKGAYASVSGTGFQPGSTVDVWLMSTPILLGEVTVDANGSFSAMLPIPAGVEAGDHIVQLNGVGADGNTRTLSVPVVVLDEVASRPLAFTGTNALSLLAWSPILFAAGTVLIVWAKRRESLTLASVAGGSAPQQ